MNRKWFSAHEILPTTGCFLDLPDMNKADRFLREFSDMAHTVFKVEGDGSNVTFTHGPSGQALTLPVCLMRETS
jgi:hypothetical protein